MRKKRDWDVFFAGGFYAEHKGIAYNLENFLQLVKDNPTEFMRYCEISVTENGLIFLACPSHAKIEEYLNKKGFKNLCQVWYDNLDFETLTKSQLKVLYALEENRLIVKGLVDYMRREKSEYNEG